MAGGLELGDAHGGLAGVGVDDGVRVPEGAARGGEDLDAGLLGELADGMVAVAGVGVRVLFEDEVGDVPGLEELGEDGLGRFAEDEEFGVFV